MLDPIEFFILDEFVLPDETGTNSEITLECPHCDTEWLVNDARVGVAVRCLACSGDFIIVGRNRVGDT